MPGKRCHAAPRPLGDGGEPPDVRGQQVTDAVGFAEVDGAEDQRLSLLARHEARVARRLPSRSRPRSRVLRERAHGILAVHELGLGLAPGARRGSPAAPPGRGAAAPTSEHAPARSEPPTRAPHAPSPGPRRTGSASRRFTVSSGSRPRAPATVRTKPRAKPSRHLVEGAVLEAHQRAARDLGQLREIVEADSAQIAAGRAR